MARRDVMLLNTADGRPEARFVPQRSVFLRSVSRRGGTSSSKLNGARETIRSTNGSNSVSGFRSIAKLCPIDRYYSINGLSSTNGSNSINTIKDR